MKKLNTTILNRLACLTFCLLFNHLAIADDNNASNSSATSANSTLKQKPSTPEFVYKYLLGEVAGQRGELPLSSHLFLDLAKSTRDPRLAERAARIASFAQQPAIALEAVKLWAELAPDSTEAQNAAIQIFVATGNFEDAKQYIEHLLTQEDTRANSFLYLNALFAKQADKQQIQRTITSLAEPYPNLAEAHFAIAHAAWSAQDAETVFNEIAVIEKLRPDWEPPILLKGQLLKDHPDEAIRYYQNFLSKNRDANDVRLALTRMLISQKKITEAKKELTRIEKNSKNTPEISLMIGLLAMDLKEYKEAERYLESALKKDIKDKDQVYIQLARVAELQRNDNKALSWLDNVKPDSERYLESRISVSQIIAHSKGPDAAIEMLDEIDNLTQEQQITVISTEVNLLAQAKRHDEAFELMHKAVINLPNTPEFVYDYAMTAERAGKLDIMEAQLYRLIKLKPDFAAAYNALGYSYADRNIKLEEAKELIEKALELSPEDHYMLDSLGWVYYRLGNYAAAETYLQRAYDIQTDPEIAAHLGEVLWVQGKHDEAKKIWQVALKTFPDNEALISTKERFREAFI